MMAPLGWYARAPERVTVVNEILHGPSYAWWWARPRLPGPTVSSSPRAGHAGSTRGPGSPPSSIGACRSSRCRPRPSAADRASLHARASAELGVVSTRCSAPPRDAHASVDWGQDRRDEAIIRTRRYAIQLDASALAGDPSDSTCGAWAPAGDRRCRADEQGVGDLPLLPHRFGTASRGPSFDP
jgi:hypothetical protein